MFAQLDTRSQAGPGPLTSMVVHVTVAAMLLAFGTAINKVTKPMQYMPLIMPQAPVVKVRPTVMPSRKDLGGHANLGNPVLVTTGASVISAVRREAAQPAMVAKLDVPSAIELPKGNTHIVAMAPQAKAAGFGGTVDAGGSGPHGKAVTGGFGTGTGSGRGAGKVITVGFDQPTAPVVVKTAQPAYVPPVVLSEMHPQYTEAAHAAHIQGEITLQVRFLATGRVEILRIVNGLGYGLDEQAMRVVEQIQFKPATRDGAPVDHVTLIHVTFQLG
jgi:TonB family protein